MKIYFLSSQPCALYFNGLYFGVTDKFERFAEISLTDKLFVEFSPQNAHPIRFFLTEEIRFSPPVGCEVFLSTNFIAIYARDFTPIDTALKIITQERFANTLVTVFQQGAIQLSIESEKSFFNATLPPSFQECSLSLHSDLIFISAQKHLAIYTKTGKCVFLEEIIDYSIDENTLNATLPLSDTLGRYAKCTYSLTEDGCYQMAFLLQQNTNIPTPKTDFAEELLAYTFFESLLLKADYRQFLHEELLANADKIPSFLGDFKSVIPTNNAKICGLIYQKQTALFEITYYEITIKDGKIADIHTAKQP